VLQAGAQHQLQQVCLPPEALMEVRPDLRLQDHCLQAAGQFLALPLQLLSPLKR
jgi:hypothetical protein